MATNQGKQVDRTLFILQYLLKSTDEQHPVTIYDLVDLCQESGHGGNRHSVKNDIDVLIRYGFDILCLKDGRLNLYYIGSRTLETAELHTLINAVTSSVFISPTKTKQLIEKLASLTGKHDAEKLCASVYTGKQAKSDNISLFPTIDHINEAIQANKKISFNHYTYNKDRLKELRNNGEEYILSPYMTLWKDDRYYVVGWCDNRNEVRSFRVDRMSVPTVLDEEAREKPADFDPEYYYLTLTKMYGEGEEMDIDLLCENHLMNTLVDHYGNSFPFESVDDDHFRATVHTVAGDTFWGWVFQYVGQMKVDGPERAKTMYYERLKAAIDD